MIPITRENVEQYLDEGVLYIAMANGNWWCLRRNGKTKTFKRSGRWYIPVKYGFRFTGRISDGELDPANIRHVDDLPPTKGTKR